jgi:DNA-binding MarR family transcriptional regulator
VNSTLSHTIPRLSEPKLRITEFLKGCGNASEDEIAEALHLHIIDVLGALLELEKKGFVKRFDNESSPASDKGEKI